MNRLMIAGPKLTGLIIFTLTTLPEGSSKKPGPVLTFLLEHPSGQKLVFDLGIRKDYQNYAPPDNRINTLSRDPVLFQDIDHVL
jgi:hypothetical protein